MKKPARPARPSPPAAAPTVETVAARLLALPQPGGELPALWRKTDFGRALSRAEKPLLDAALAWLESEGRLVALAHGENVFYAWVDALRAKPAPVAAAGPDDLLAVYRRLVRESGGFPDVKISQLARALGPAAGGLADRLIALWRTGDVTLSLGDWSLANEETRAAAVELEGEQCLLVRFEEPLA